MTSTRDINQKINSLGNMQKVMRAMNMIATVKLRKLFPGLEALEEFTRTLESFRLGALGKSSAIPHPLVRGYRTARLAHVILFTADKGLCGPHNNRALKALDILRARKSLENVEIELTCIGNKGALWAKRKKYNLFHRTSISEKVLDARELNDLAHHILGRFEAGEVQEIHVIYHSFVTPIQQETRTVCLLPLALSDPLTLPPDQSHQGVQGNGQTGTVGSPASTSGASSDGFSGEPDTAPGPDGFLPALASRLFLLELQAARAHSALSEQASRMTAMENASNNSKELIGRYMLLRNRARQASITNELIEIISGTEAMKG